MQMELGHSPLAHYKRLQEGSTLAEAPPSNVLRFKISSSNSPTNSDHVIPISQYTWQDCSTHVDLRILLPRAVFPNDVDCHFGHDSMQLHVRGRRMQEPTQHRRHGLAIRTLHGKLNVDLCTWSLYEPACGVLQPIPHTEARAGVEHHTATLENSKAPVRIVQADQLQGSGTLTFSDNGTQANPVSLNRLGKTLFLKSSCRNSPRLCHTSPRQICGRLKKMLHVLPRHWPIIPFELGEGCGWAAEFRDDGAGYNGERCRTEVTSLQALCRVA